jgi:hypothetical protein
MTNDKFQMTNRFQIGLAGFFLVIGVVLPSFCLADTIYLTSGEVAKGLVVEEHNDRIVLSTYKGEVQIPKVSIEQIFFDTEEQNYAYLGDKAFDEGNLDLALDFYQKSYQINHDFEKIRWAFLRLVDAINRKKFNILPANVTAELKKQIGITVERSGDKIKVVSVREGSAAANADIAAGNLITAAWDASLMYMDPLRASELMLGAPNTPIRLAIEKDIILPVKDAPWIIDILHLKRFRNFGFNLSLRPSGLIVVYINPQGISQKKGLKIMDEVTHINGEPTRYMSVSIVRRKIFQSNLKEVTLTIKRLTILTRRDL